MSKPKTGLRRPPSPRSIDSFVGGETPAVAKPDRVRLTVYLPPDLAKRLRIAAVTEGDQISHLVERAVAAYLAE